MAVVKVQLALTSASWDMFHRLALEVFLRVQLAGFPPKPKQISERIRGFFSFWPDGRSILEIVRVNRVCSQVTGLFSRMTLKMCYPSRIKMVLSFDRLWCEDLMVITMTERTTHALRAFYHFPFVGKRRTISNFGQIYHRHWCICGMLWIFSQACYSTRQDKFRGVVNKLTRIRIHFYQLN